MSSLRMAQKPLVTRVIRVIPEAEQRAEAWLEMNKK